MNYPFEVSVEVRKEYDFIIFAETKREAESIANELDSELETWGLIPDYDAYVNTMDAKRIQAILQSTDADDIIVYKDGEWVSPKEAFSDEPILKPELEGQEKLLFK